MELRRGRIERAAEMKALSAFNYQLISEDEVDSLRDFYLKIMRREASVDETVSNFPTLATDDDFLVGAYLISGEGEKALKIIADDPDGDLDSFYHIWTNVDPELRNYPYFATFVQNTGLLAYWRANGFPDQCSSQNNNKFQCR